MLASDDAALIARARNLAAAARLPAVHYEHAEVGFNYRMLSLAAAWAWPSWRRWRPRSRVAARSSTAMRPGSAAATASPSRPRPPDAVTPAG